MARATRKRLTEKDVKAKADRAERKTEAKIGRPDHYTETIANQICEWLAEGKSLRVFCMQPDAPSPSMVYRWLTKYPEFRDNYVRAREEQAETWADEIVFIADTAEDAQLARVRIDARKWVASKLKPKVYGDKVSTELTGKDGGPIETKDVSDLEVARRLAFLLGKAVAKGEAAKAKSDTVGT